MQDRHRFLARNIHNLNTIDIKVRDKRRLVHHQYVILSAFPRLILRVSAITGDALNLGEVPLLVAERAHTSRLQPSLDAIQVKNMSAGSERDTEAVLVVGGRACLREFALSWKELRYCREIGFKSSDQHT